MTAVLLVFFVYLFVDRWMDHREMDRILDRYDDLVRQIMSRLAARNRSAFTGTRTGRKSEATNGDD